MRSAGHSRAALTISAPGAPAIRNSNSSAPKARRRRKLTGQGDQFAWRDSRVAGVADRRVDDMDQGHFSLQRAVKVHGYVGCMRGHRLVVDCRKNFLEGHDDLLRLEAEGCTVELLSHSRTLPFLNVGARMSRAI
jgi:hypothetical protein